MQRIAESTDQPLTVDFEGRYAVEPTDIAVNIHKLIKTGAIGLNVEDRIVQGEGLYSAAIQAENIPLFINARTDLYSQFLPKKTRKFTA